MEPIEEKLAYHLESERMAEESAKNARCGDCIHFYECPECSYGWCRHNEEFVDGYDFVGDCEGSAFPVLFESAFSSLVDEIASLCRMHNKSADISVSEKGVAIWNRK